MTKRRENLPNKELLLRNDALDNPVYEQLVLFDEPVVKLVKEVVVEDGIRNYKVLHIIGERAFP